MSNDLSQNPDIRTLTEWIDESERITVLTGAGISTDSGIPDFRGPNGIWTKNPKAEKASNIQNFIADPEVRKASWRDRLDNRAWSADPNDGHRALVQLEKRNKLVLITDDKDKCPREAPEEGQDLNEDGCIDKEITTDEIRYLEKISKLNLAQQLLFALIAIIGGALYWERKKDFIINLFKRTYIFSFIF